MVGNQSQSGHLQNLTPVSILVLLEDGRKRRGVCTQGRSWSMFQSLFCWKMVGNLFVRPRKPWGIRICFNPCLTRDPFGILLEDGRKPVAIRTSTESNPGFNPCLTRDPFGILLEDGRKRCSHWSLHRRYRVSILVSPEIPSGFCWKTVGNHNNWIIVIVTIMFQSLFCWKTVGNYKALRASIARYSVSILVSPEIPSGFCWKTVGNQSKLKNLKTLSIVSILVLLEDGRKLFAPLSFFIDYRGFNPCSVGRRSETPNTAHRNFDLDCFNPCSVGRRSETKLDEHCYCFELTRFNPCSVGRRSETPFCFKTDNIYL